MTTYLERRDKQWYVATMDGGFNYGRPHRRMKDALEEARTKLDSSKVLSQRVEYGIYKVWIWGSGSSEFYVGRGYQLLDSGFSAITVSRGRTGVRNTAPLRKVLNEISQYPSNTPFYGYDLSVRLDIARGTLYPILRRMEDEGWLRSKVDRKNIPARRMYVLTAAGRKAVKERVG